MKTLMPAVVSLSLLLFVANRASANQETTGPAESVRIAAVSDTASVAVPDKVALSSADLARYRQLAEASQAREAGDERAGAAGNTTLIIVGVVVLVAVIALAAGGGGGGGYQARTFPAAATAISAGCTPPGPSGVEGQPMFHIGQPVGLRRMGAGMALGVCVLLCGCSSVSRFNGLTLDSDAIYVSGITPVMQDKRHGCGAACVAAVASQWGVAPTEFGRRHGPAPNDTTARDLQTMAGKLGLHGFAYEGSMEDLVDNLKKGRPLIVMIPMPVMARGGPLSAALLGAWNAVGPRPAHWVVVLGTIGERHVILHDPASGPLQVRRDRFEDWWARKGYRCVLIARAG